MSELTDSQMAVVGRRDNVTSRQIRENFENIKNALNSERADRLAMTTPPIGSEVTDARSGEDVLNTRLAQHIEAYGKKHIAGGGVLAQDTPDMTIKIGGVRAVVGGNVVNRGLNRSASADSSLVTINDKGHGLVTSDKIYATASGNLTYLPLTEHTITRIDDDTFTVPSASGTPSPFVCTFSRYSPTISAPSGGGDFRYDVIVVNSAYEIEIVTGAESNAPELPTLSDTQVPLAFYKLSQITTIITDSLITSCIGQGVTDQDGNWTFTIQDAVDNLPSTGGVLFINTGNYYEEVNIIGINNLELIGIGKPILHRPAATQMCISCINTVSLPKSGLTINGLAFEGDGLAGAFPFIQTDYTDEIIMKNCIGDGNTSSTLSISRKILDMTTCDGIQYTDNYMGGGSPNPTGNTNYKIESNGNIETDYDINISGNISNGSGDVTIDDNLMVNQNLESFQNVSFNRSYSVNTGQGITEVYRRLRTLTKTTEILETVVDVQYNFTGTMHVYGSCNVERTGGAGTINFFIRISKNGSTEKEVQLDVPIAGVALIEIDDDITVIPSDNIQIQLLMTLNSNTGEMVDPRMILSYHDIWGGLEHATVII